MARRTAKARGKCPYCNKQNVRISISVRSSGGVNAKWNVHDGMYVDSKTGKNERCKGSGKALPNRDIPPMSTWE